jgi:hypothetical protein
VSTESLALVKSESPAALAVQDMPTAFVPRSFADAQMFAKALAESSLVPTALRNSAANVLMTIMAGAELGIAPIASMRLFHVIEGVPKLTADGIAGLCQRARACEYLRPKKGAPQTAESVTWVAKRRDADEEIEVTWTRADVKTAGLWDRKDKYGNPGQHQKYPRQMLNARAKAEVCRLTWPEICGGMISAEEQRDIDAIDAEFVEIPASKFQPLQNALPAANPTIGIEKAKIADLPRETVLDRSALAPSAVEIAAETVKAREEALAKAGDAARELEAARIEAQPVDDVPPPSDRDAPGLAPMAPTPTGATTGKIDNYSTETIAQAKADNAARGYPAAPAECADEDIENLTGELYACGKNGDRRALAFIASRISALAMTKDRRKQLGDVYTAVEKTIRAKESRR